MASTTFVNRVTPIQADWLNYVNGAVYGTEAIPYTTEGTGAVATTINDKLSSIELSVVDFGADPTGTSTSTAAFLKAKDRALALIAAYGGRARIVIPAGGKFRLDTTFRFEVGENDITVDGTGALVFKGVDSATSMVRFYGDNLELVGLAFDGRKADFTTELSMLFCYGDNLLVRGCHFRNSTKNGLAFGNDTGVITTGAQVLGNIFIANDGVGISVAHASELIISGNRISTSGLEGLTLDQGAAYTTVVNNILKTNNQTGSGIGAIGYDAMQNCTISNNIIIGDGTKPAIRQGNATGGSNSIAITGNNLHNHTVGIDLRGTSGTLAGDQNFTIADNTFKACTTAIAYDGDNSRIYIGHNTFAADVTTPMLTETTTAAGPPAVTPVEAGTATVVPGLCKWSVRKGTASTNNVTGDGTLAQVTYDLEYPTGVRVPATFDSGTGAVTVPFSGMYQLMGSVEIINGTGATSGVIEIKADGTTISRRKYDFDGTMGDITMDVVSPAEFLTSGSTITVHASLTGIGADTADFSNRPLGSEFYGSNV